MGKQQAAYEAGLAAAKRPSPFSVFMHYLLELIIIVGIGAVLYWSWPLFIAMKSGQVQPLQPTPEPAVMPTQRAGLTAAEIEARVRAAIDAMRQNEQAAPAPVVAPTPYTMATAEAISQAEYQAIVQEQIAPAPNQSRAVESAGDVNTDWCRGSHLSRPECRPGNGSKEE